MKTPMQQLLDYVQQSVIPDYELPSGFEQKIIDLIERERVAIVSAFAWGNITKVQYKSQHIAGEDYYNDRYNETFNTKEK